MAAVRQRALAAAVIVLDLAVVVHLAGSLRAAAMFVAFAACIVVPVVFLARSPIVILAVVPWFFLRKAIGMPLLVDVATAAALIACAFRWGARPRVRMPAVTFVVVPLLFALVWLGWNVPVGNEIREYGLFGIDFGNLVAVVSTIRASPMLPLSYVAGTGPLSYHWLYFTSPAALADFGGGSMPNANALVLANLLMAMLLVQAVASIASNKVAAAIVLFAPFTTYFYQAIAARIALGPLALPTRNHLLLSPLNGMITFGNNSVAIVLAIVALVQLERWNHDGRLHDLVAGCVALAAIIGYSITLVFPLALADDGLPRRQPHRRERLLDEDRLADGDLLRPATGHDTLARGGSRRDGGFDPKRCIRAAVPALPRSPRDDERRRHRARLCERAGLDPREHAAVGDRHRPARAREPRRDLHADPRRAPRLAADRLREGVPD